MCTRDRSPEKCNFTKSGNVKSALDKLIGRKVLRLRGSVCAANYVVVPGSKKKSLGLTGAYVYTQIRASKEAKFCIHIDVATDDKQAVRLTLSNIYSKAKCKGAQ